MAPPVLQVLLAIFLLGGYALAPPASGGAGFFHPWLSPLFALSVSLAPFFLGRASVDRLRRRLAAHEPDIPRIARGFSRADRAIRLSVTGSYALALYAGNWPRSVSSLGASLGFEKWPLLSWALGFAPFLVAFVASLDPAYRLQFLAQPRAWTRREFFTFHIRSAAFVLVPLALVFVLFASLYASETLKRWMDLFDYLNLAALVVFLGLLFVAAPVLMRWLLGAHRLPDGPLRASLEAFARRIGFVQRDMLVVHTSGNLVNALIVGILPPLRYVIFTDALVVNLPPDEILAVFAHEVGHAKRFHLGIFLAFLLTSLFLLLILLRFVFPLAPSLLNEEKPLAWIAILAFLGIYVGIGFGFLSRRIERDADLYGVRSVGDTSMFVSALERCATLAGGVRLMRNWRHFSIARRVAFLEEAERNPALIRRARRSLLACLLLLAGIFAGSLSLVAEDVRGQHQAGLGRLALERENLAEAEARLREAIDHSPRDPRYRYFLGVTYAKEGRLDAAREEWELALRLAPSEDLREATQGNLEEIESDFQVKSRARTEHPSSQ